MKIKFKKLNPNAIVPNKKSSTEGSGAYDLSTTIEAPVTLEPNEFKSFPTGIAIHIDNSDYVGLVYGRSGLGFKEGVTLTNCVGVIDSDYTGEIMVSLVNHSSKPYTINPLDRIAQLTVTRIEQLDFEEVDKFDETDRNENGFGSSGR